MRQIWIPRIGGPEVLELREAPDPEPKAGEVRVRVAASGVNFADLAARVGLYPDRPPLPCVVGYEVSGKVDKLGPGVDDGLALGTRVLCLTRFGGYSDVICVPALQALPIPESVSDEVAAAVPVVYLTAWIMLVKLGNVEKGERVLVQAVAGGVGQAALQICKWKGAEVIGTASASKHARLKDQGVAHCIDYTTQDFETEVMRITEGKGVDVAIDAVGGASLRKSYNCLAPMGRVFCFGASSAVPGSKRNIPAALKMVLQMPKFRPMKLMDQNKGVFGVNVGHMWGHIDKLRPMLDAIVARVKDGTFAPPVDKSFPFTQVADAHRYIQERKNFGKVLLIP